MRDRWPRGMNAETAAEYCGIGVTTLRNIGPKPAKIGDKRVIWLREDLDSWLDRLAGRTTVFTGEDPWPADDGTCNASIPASL